MVTLLNFSVSVERTGSRQSLTVVEGLPGGGGDWRVGRGQVLAGKTLVYVLVRLFSVNRAGHTRDTRRRGVVVTTDEYYREKK